MSTRLDGHHRTIGRAAWAMAWVGLVVGQLHALARARTADGAEDWEYPLFAAWGRPATDLLSPLLTWADPDVVYVMYGKIWTPVLLVATLCAMVVRDRRRPGRVEAWVWRVAIALYLALCVGGFLDYWMQWTGDYNGDGIEAKLFTVGTWVMFGSLPFALLASTALGLTLLLKRFRPVLPCLLLLLAIPLGFAVTEVTSLGSVLLPTVFAFGILGRRIARAEPDRSAAPTRVADRAA